MSRVSRVRALASAITFATFVQCSSEASAPRAPTELRAVIGAEGGTLRAADGTAVEIPKGALANDVLIVLRKAGAAAPSPGRFAVGVPAGSAIELLPDGLQFAKPVTVVLALDVTSSDATRVVVLQNGAALSTRQRDATHVEIQTTHF